MSETIPDEVVQKAEWRARLMGDVLSNMHDDETRAAMLEAGLAQAHEEGLLDAAYICDEVAKTRPNAAIVASVIAKAIRDLAARNANR